MIRSLFGVLLILFFATFTAECADYRNVFMTNKVLKWILNIGQIVSQSIIVYYYFS